VSAELLLAYKKTGCYWPVILFAKRQGTSLNNSPGHLLKFALTPILLFRADIFSIINRV